MSTERTLRTRAALHRILGRQNLVDNSFVEVECAVMEVAALCDEGKLRPSNWRAYRNRTLMRSKSSTWHKSGHFVEVKLAEAVIPASRSKTFVLRRVLGIVLRF
jgi:hypothetical protein